MRGDVTEAESSLRAQQAGNAGAPTPQQASLLNKYDPQLRTLNYYRNELGDYSMQVQQMEQDHYGAGAALSLSTEESKRGKQSMQRYAPYKMLMNQPNQFQRSEKALKLAKKNPKLTGSDYWM